MKDLLLNKKVMIIDKGDTYSSYKELLIKNNVQQEIIDMWVCDKLPENNSIGTVIDVLRYVEKDEDFNQLLVKIENNVYIIGQRGLMFLQIT